MSHEFLLQMIIYIKLIEIISKKQVGDNETQERKPLSYPLGTSNNQSWQNQIKSYGMTPIKPHDLSQLHYDLEMVSSQNC